MKKQIYRVLFIALMTLMQTTMAQAQVNNEVRKVPPGAPQNVMVREALKDENQIHFKHKKSNHVKRAEEDLTLYPFTVNLVFDETKYVCMMVIVYNNRESYMPIEYYPNSRVLSVPKGEYDVFVKYSSLSPSLQWPAQDYIVIKENIKIDKETSITVTPEEATNKVELITYLANGEIAQTAHRDPTQLDENGTWVTLEPGNVKIISHKRIISSEGRAIGSGDSEQWTIDNRERKTTFYVNDVSNKYTFSIYEFIKGNDETMYTAYFEKQGGSAEVLENNPEDYVLYEQKFAQSEYGKEFTKGVKHFSEYFVENEYYRAGTSMSSENETEDETVRIYMGKAPNKNLCTGVYLGRVDLEKNEIVEYPWGEEEEYICKCVVSQPIIQKDGVTKVIRNGSVTLHEDTSPFMYYRNEVDLETGVIKVDNWEENPILSYNTEKIKGIHGDNVPIINYFKTSYWDIDNNKSVTVFSPFFLGRFGESCETDALVSQMNVKANGRLVVNSSRLVHEWQEETEKLTGSVDITLTNENRKIDELQGKNLTTIHYDRDYEDSTAPVLQMLHFKDGEGYITDRFDTSEGALLELFAGDYNEGISEQNWLYFDRAKAKTVAVAYAPYGKDNWTELTLEENPEYYSNLMGWYYAASLEDVAGAAEQGWFDLKIRLEDEAGNWQEQVISPAFQIKSLVDTGISQLTIDNGQLTIRGNENVYDLMGRCIGNAPSSTDKGIRIVRKANGDFRKVVLR